MSKPPLFCLVIPVHGPCRIETLPGEKNLESMQKLVGGYIEAVSLANIGHSPRQIRELAVLWVNEDGIGLGLDKNERATRLVCDSIPVGLMSGDFIKGDAILTGPTDDEGDLTCVSDAILSLIVEAGIVGSRGVRN